MKIRGIRDKKIRILYLVGQLGLGGSERQLSLLLQHFDMEKYEITVVVFNPSPYYELNDMLEAAGVRVVAIPERVKGVWGRIRFLYSLFRELSPDVAHSWTVHDNPYAGLVGWLAGVPVRWGSVRGSIYAKGFQSLPGIYRWLSLHAVTKLVVNAASIENELANNHYPPENIIVLPNCTNARSPVASFRKNAPGKPKRVGMVGNLRSVKNHAMFIDGMAKVISSIPDAEAVIVGQPIPAEPHLYQQLQSRIAAYHLNGQIKLLGHRKDVPELMRSFSVFCLTSRSEGTPNVILEAMAAGLPVVATRVGGVPDVVQEGKTGFLVGPEDINEFASRVKQILQNPIQAKKMGIEGRRIVERKYNCALAVSRLTNVYRNALRKTGHKT